MCVNPYYGFQLAQPNVRGSSQIVPLNSAQPCADLVYESPTQGGQVSGRAWIWSAILAADDKFRNYVGYWPVPTQTCDEIHFQRPYTGGILRLRDAKIKGMGKIAYTLLGVAPLEPTQFLDLNNDTVIDTVRITVTVPSTVQDLDEIEVFLHEEDREHVDSFCRAQVRPIKTRRLDDGSVTIDMPVWNLVRPILYRGYAVGAIDPNNIANYVPKVEIYRKWIDPAGAVTIMRDAQTGCDCKSDASECYDCENVEACIVNAEAGVIRVDMKGDSASSCYCGKCANRMCINYVAGDCGHPELIARVAAAELRGEICCGTSAEVRYWQADYIGTDSRGRIVTSLLVSEQGNPFGTRRGQVEAYRFLRERRKLKAVRI